ncbi:uncharacterized protein PODANS_0_350 [Podospora anserina S mat+]|uniref:Podospora anserina S mat+ genomic DNA chromosome 4, supercontig 2 n=1 Tax=Podospora anserina (strain S / ATCC MYA-4624 / DSM 980 / FGSC 10383) TaxID=515849 RepID=B2ADW9_PODAN|nr:uncharacterized protein PODANS_0_350 [Podospora anserina S mat+]CAP61634.1 unnamed protein product [Podospora anserina S mat+]CDP27987.1 Putative protein of unknown function [Podospora anserina S mat+]
MRDFIMSYNTILTNLKANTCMKRWLGYILRLRSKFRETLSTRGRPLYQLQASPHCQAPCVMGSFNPTGRSTKH